MKCHIIATGNSESQFFWLSDKQHTDKFEKIDNNKCQYFNDRSEFQKRVWECLSSLNPMGLSESDRKVFLVFLRSRCGRLTYTHSGSEGEQVLEIEGEFDESSVRLDMKMSPVIKRKELNILKHLYTGPDRATEQKIVSFEDVQTETSSEMLRAFYSSNLTKIHVVFNKGRNWDQWYEYVKVPQDYTIDSERGDGSGISI
jgi:hypothetical protein